MLLPSVLCSGQFFGHFSPLQVGKASLQRTSSTIILVMFENMVNNSLFALLVVFFLNRLIFSHIGCHLEFIELPKGNNSTPTWILLYTSKRNTIHRKKTTLSDETGLAKKLAFGCWTMLLHVHKDITYQFDNSVVAKELLILNGYHIINNCNNFVFIF